MSDDEVIVKSSKNCSLGMHPGTLTLTDRRLTFTTLLRKKVKFNVPLSAIDGVDAFGGNRWKFTPRTACATGSRSML